MHQSLTELKSIKSFEKTESDTRHSETKQVSFSSAVADYLRSGHHDRAGYLARLCTYFSGVPVAEIDQARIEHAALAICGSASALSTHNRQVYTPTSAILKFAAKRGWCKSFRIKRPTVIKRVSPLPTPHDVDRFIKAAGPGHRRIFIFLIGTGSTVREALRLDWQQINLAHGTVELRNVRGQIVTIILPARLVEMLARFGHHGGKVFRRPDGSPYSENVSAGGQIKKAVEGAQRRSGVKITLRMLRQVWRSRNNAESN